MVSFACSSVASVRSKVDAGVGGDARRWNQQLRAANPEGAGAIGVRNGLGEGALQFCWGFGF